MKSFIKIFVLLGLTFNVNAQVPNDVCATAIDLGTLPAPAACPGGAGTLFTYNGTTTNAVAENPYSSLACMDAPAADVWVSFVASGNEMTLNFTSGLNDANIGIYNLIVTNFKARKLSSIRITDKPRTENVYSFVFVYRHLITNITHEEYAEIKLQTNHSYKNPLISRSVNYYCQ